MATSNSKSDLALFRQYVSQELYHHNCRVHSQVMYLQPLKSNIISRVKPPHTIPQPGLWAAEHVCHLPHGHLLVNASPHLFSLRQQLQEYTLLYGMLEGYVVSLNCLFIQHEYSKNCMNFHAIQERNKAIVDIRLCLQWAIPHTPLRPITDSSNAYNQATAPIWTIINLSGSILP